MSFAEKILYFIFIVGLIFVANLIAQKLFPTRQGHDAGDRMAYRLIVYLIFLGLIAAVIGIGFVLG